MSITQIESLLTVESKFLIFAIILMIKWLYIFSPCITGITDTVFPTLLEKALNFWI